MFLSQAREIKQAFSARRETGDPAVDGAVTTLVRAAEHSEALGFWQRQSIADPMETATRMLAEHGQNLTTEQVGKVMDQLSTIEQARVARRRFWLQAVVTLVVLIPSLGVALGYVDNGDATQKAAAGFVGATIGYWLR